MYFIKTNLSSGNYIIGKLLKRHNNYDPNKTLYYWDIEIIKNHGYHLAYEHGKNGMMICPPIFAGFTVEIFTGVSELMAKVI